MLICKFVPKTTVFLNKTDSKVRTLGRAPRVRILKIRGIGQTKSCRREVNS